jgi:hypothetical protein
MSVRICVCCGGLILENEDTSIHNPNLCAACFNLPDEMEEFVSCHQDAEFGTNQIMPVVFGDANHGTPVSISER